MRSYSGPDPLSAWYEYIVWVEQTGRREGNLKTQDLKTLLEKCIEKLRDDKRLVSEHHMDVTMQHSMYRVGQHVRELGLVH